VARDELRNAFVKKERGQVREWGGPEDPEGSLPSHSLHTLRRVDVEKLNILYGRADTSVDIAADFGAGNLNSTPSAGSSSD